MHEARAQRHVAHRKAAAVVRRSVLRVAVVCGLARRVQGERERRDARLQRRRVDDALEDGAGLASRVGRAVELRRGVRVTADHREHVSGLRVESDESGLWPAPPFENFFEPRELAAHRLLGDPLKLKVNRRVDA